MPTRAVDFSVSKDTPLRMTTESSDESFRCRLTLLIVYTSRATPDNKRILDDQGDASPSLSHNIRFTMLQNDRQ